jgi:hypothetical protein
MKAWVSESTAQGIWPSDGDTVTLGHFWSNVDDVRSGAAYKRNAFFTRSAGQAVRPGLTAAPGHLARSPPPASTSIAHATTLGAGSSPRPEQSRGVEVEYEDHRPTGGRPRHRRPHPEHRPRCRTPNYSIVFFGSTENAPQQKQSPADNWASLKPPLYARGVSAIPQDQGGGYRGRGWRAKDARRGRRPA